MPRPDIDTEIAHHTKILEFLIVKHREIRRQRSHPPEAMHLVERTINKKEFARIADVEPRNVGRILDEVIALSRELQLTSAGAEFGDLSYHASQVERNQDLKQAIASSAASYLPAGASVACSPGSTVEMVVRDSNNKHLRIVTNGFGLLNYRFGNNVHLELCGGVYHRPTHAAVGPSAAAAFRSANCRISLIGVSGASADGRFFVRHAEELEVLSEIVRAARDEILVVADATKLVQVDHFEFATVQNLMQEREGRKITLFTNAVTDLNDSARPSKGLPPWETQIVETISGLTNMGVEVICSAPARQAKKAKRQSRSPSSTPASVDLPTTA